MADMVLIQSAISGLKTAADIAKGFLELKSIADVQGKVIELQSAILSAQSSALAAQSEQSTMVQRIRDLEEEVRRVKAWEETRQRYQLVSPIDGVFFYALKKDSSTSEPPHWVCTNCYESGKRSIIHRQWNPARGLEFNCPQCKSLIHPQSSECGLPTYA